jgi:hypothetical protein
LHVCWIENFYTTLAFADTREGDLKMMFRIAGAMAGMALLMAAPGAHAVDRDDPLEVVEEIYDAAEDGDFEEFGLLVAPTIMSTYANHSFFSLLAGEKEVHDDMEFLILGPATLIADAPIGKGEKGKGKPDTVKPDDKPMPDQGQVPGQTPAPGQLPDQGQTPQLPDQGQEQLPIDQGQEQLPDQTDQVDQIDQVGQTDQIDQIGPGYAPVMGPQAWRVGVYGEFEEEHGSRLIRTVTVACTGGAVYGDYDYRDDHRGRRGGHRYDGPYNRGYRGYDDDYRRGHGCGVRSRCGHRRDRDQICQIVSFDDVVLGDKGSIKK